MQCTRPIRITKNIDVGAYPLGMLVPCGKCLACRIARRRDYYIRCLHELEFCDCSSFITLTYSSENLPDDNSLDIEALRKFFKRVRKALDKQERKLRVMACGEYGDLTERPHYHALLFGLGLSPEDKQLVIDAWPYCDWSNPHIRQKSFGLVEADSIRYVCQYIDKKYTGALAEREYKARGREPVFRILSPGLGREYADKYAQKIIEQGYITIHGNRYSLPRYYIKRLGIDTEPLKAFGLDKDCEITERYTGLYMQSDDFLRICTRDEELTYESRRQEARNQHDANLTSKVAIKQSRL